MRQRPGVSIDPENKGGRPLHVRERRAEGRRASESSAPKSLLMEHAGSRLEAAVASCNRSRPWSGRSNLSRDSPWVGAGVTTSGMRRESRWGSVISSNGMAILHGDSAGRFRFAKKRKTARRRAPLRPTTGGKKAGSSAKRTTARGSVRGSHGSRSRGRCRSVANRWSHTHRSRCF